MFQSCFVSLCVQCALATSPKFPQMTAFECNVNKICKLNLGCACLCTKRGFSGGIRALSHICTFGERESSRCVALVMMMRGFKSYWPGSIWWRVLFRWFYGKLEAGRIYDNLKYTSEYFFIHRFFFWKSRERFMDFGSTWISCVCWIFFSQFCFCRVIRLSHARHVGFLFSSSMIAIEAGRDESWAWMFFFLSTIHLMRVNRIPDR